MKCTGRVHGTPGVRVSCPEGFLGETGLPGQGREEEEGGTGICAGQIS